MALPSTFWFTYTDYWNGLTASTWFSAFCFKYGGWYWSCSSLMFKLWSCGSWYSSSSSSYSSWFLLLLLNDCYCWRYSRPKRDWGAITGAPFGASSVCHGAWNLLGRSYCLGDRESENSRSREPSWFCILEFLARRAFIFSTCSR